MGGKDCIFASSIKKKYKKMKKVIKWILRLVAISVIGICVFAVNWAWKYYQLPLLPDYGKYENLAERAESALAVARRLGLSEKYCLFTDYSIPSGTPRMFVWSFEQERVVASTYVMHGPGMGSTDEVPVFSNKPGSNCSSLGRFAVTHEMRLSMCLRTATTRIYICAVARRGNSPSSCTSSRSALIG